MCRGTTCVQASVEVRSQKKPSVEIHMLVAATSLTLWKDTVRVFYMSDQKSD
jgi:hypothetical protein